MDLDGIWHDVSTWSDQSHTPFVMSDQYSGGFVNKKKLKKVPFNIGLNSDIYRPISFKLDVIINISKLYGLILE